MSETFHESKLLDGKGPVGWPASLRLDYEAIGQRTVLRHEHRGPLRVQRPFYPEGGVNHTYLLHPPGGLVADDQLDILTNVAAGAQALVTTPGAAKVYRSIAGPVRVRQHLRVDGELEWLPQETILFNQSQILSETVLQFGAQGRGVFWDVQCLGRPAGAHPYEQGNAEFVLRVANPDGLLLMDRLRLDAPGQAQHAAWGLRGRQAIGVMVAYPVDQELCEQVQHLLQDEPWMQATLLDHLLVIRGLADQATDLRAGFVSVWRQIRPALLQRKLCEPRIWAT